MTQTTHQQEKLDVASDTVLDVRNLSTQFRTQAGVIKAVDNVSFNVKEGEVLAIVGESGCGKSVSALSVMRLVPTPPGEITDGQVLFGGQDLLQLRNEEMREVRGGQIGMIFQEPMTSLNPVMTIGAQIAESLMIHKGMSKEAALDRAEELLISVGVSDARLKMDDYPHQMSGGQRQRVMICLLYTSPSPRDGLLSRMPSSA